jgi:hypothetical protein
VVDIRLFHHRQELPGISRQRFHIAALALGIYGVERQRRLPGAREPGEDDELVARQAQVEIPEVVRARAANVDRFHEGVL